MEPVAGIVVVLLLAPSSLAVPDWDYDLYEDLFPVPLLRPMRIRAVPVPVFKPIVTPEDLFPQFHSASPWGPYANTPAAKYYRMPDPGLAIVDDMKHDPDTIVVRQTSGKHPPALPYGMDTLKGTARSLRYDMPSSRRTLGMLARGINNIIDPGLSVERDEIELKRQRDRLEELRFQASLDRLRNQHYMDDITYEKRNWNDKYDSTREYEAQLALERLRTEQKYNLMERDLRLKKLENDIYSQNDVTRIREISPKYTTRTRFTFGLG